MRSTGEQVAVKLLRPDLADDPVLVARFLREADALRLLDHPNLVRLRDVVLERGRLGLVVDLVDGGDLRARLDAVGRMRPAEAAEVVAQVAAALTAVHGAGIAHRDVKPANVLLGRDGRARLADLGIARLASAPELTRHTGVVGTPDYLAPEAATGEAVAASDVYGLGVVLHELLAGQVPFRGAHPVAVLRQHLESPPPVLPVTAPLADLLAAMLAKDPAARPTAAQVQARLEALAPALADEPALTAAPSAPASAASTAETQVRHRTGSVATTADPEPSGGRRRPLLVAAAAAAALALVAGGAVAVTARDGGSPLVLAGGAPSASASPSADPTAGSGGAEVEPTEAAQPLPPAPEDAGAGPVIVPGAVGEAAGGPGAGTLPGGTAAAGSTGSTEQPTARTGSSGPGGGQAAAPPPPPPPAPAPAATTAPPAAQPQPPPPPPPTQPAPIPGSAPEVRDRRCSGAAQTSVNGATVETVSCIGYITSSTGRQLVQADTYVREVPGSTHNSYSRFRGWVQLRRADGSFVTERICEVTGDFNQPTSDGYWARCGLSADVAPAGLVSVGFARGEGPAFQTDPGRLSRSPAL